VKIGDFGISKSLESSRQMARTYCGTPVYMAPEIMAGKLYDHKADIWSLGCILFELCTFKLAFSGGNFMYCINHGKYDSHLVSQNYSSNVSSLIQKMLTVNPNKRPSAEQILRSDDRKNDKKPRSRGGNVEKNKVDGDKHRHNVNIKDLPKPVKNLPIGNEVHHIDINIDSHKKNEDYFKIFNKMNEDIFRDNNFGFGINHDFEYKFKNIHLDPGFNRFPDRRRDVSPGRFRDASPGRMIVESPGRERIGRDIFIDQGNIHIQAEKVNSGNVSTGKLDKAINLGKNLKQKYHKFTH